MAQMPTGNTGNTGNTTGGRATPPPLPRRNAGSVTKLFGALADLTENLTVWTAKEAKERLDSLKLLFKISVIIPAFLFTLGMIVGRTGVAIESDWMQGFATGAFSWGTLLGAVLVSGLWIKVMIYGHGGALLSRGVASLSDRFTGVSTQQVESFLFWLRGWTAWFIGAALILTHFKIYKSITSACVLIAALLLVAAIMGARWSDSPWPRRILSYCAVLIVCSRLFYFAAPEAHAAVNAWSASQLTRSTAWLNTQSSVAREEAAAETQEEQDIAERLNSNHVRLAELRQRAADQNCAGVYCAEDADEYRQLQAVNAALRQQALVNQSVAEEDSAEAEAIDEDTAPASSGPATVRRLPPPPRVTPTPRPTGPAQRHGSPRPVVASADTPAAAPISPERETGPSGLPRLTTTEIDDIFSSIH